MTNVKIIDKAYGGYHRLPNPDNRWDSGHSFTEHCLTGLQVDKYGDIEVDFKIKKNTPYHLLYITYDTGDSFGRDDGRISFVDLYEDFNVADANYRRLLNHYDRHPKGYSTKLVAENGKKYTYGVPGTGYFDNNASVHLETLYLQEN